VLGWTAGTPGPAFRYTCPTAIPADLPVGPSPTFDPSSVPDDTPPLDPDAVWLVDFAAAEKVGMAMRVPLPPEAVDVVERLIVYGVAEDGDESPGGDTLADLFEAHYYTGGLDYVPLGTPTNNTATANSGYSFSDPARRAAMQVRHGDAAPKSEDSAARRLAAALGLDLAAPEPDGIPNGLGRAPNAGCAEPSESRAMNTALWPTTFGYFLWQLAGGYCDDAAVRRGRRHFIDHVRAGGPLPTLRIGDQPYGVLPVMTLANWSPCADEVDTGLGVGCAQFLQRLRTGLWQPATERVPRAEPAGGDPQQELLRILGMAPVSQEFAARSALGADYLTWLWRFVDDFELDGTWHLRLRDAARALGTRLGLTDWRPRVGELIFASESFRIDAPLVDGPTPGSLPSSYLTLLADADAAELLRFAEADTSAAHTPLLYRLVRHGALVEHAMAGWRTMNRGAATLVPPGDHREPELVDILSAPTTTFARRLEQSVPTPSGRRTALGEYLRAPDPADPATTDLVELRGALRQLARLNSATLERLTAETLDLSSHRLDAWITSYASRRLVWMRSRPPVAGRDPARGAYLGAYGWLHDIARRQPADCAAAVAIVSAATPSVPVVTTMPNQRPKAFVLVGDIGTDVVDPVTATARIVVDCWAKNTVTARSLAVTAGKALSSAVGTTVGRGVVRSWTMREQAVEVPDPAVADMRRWRFFGDLTVTGAHLPPQPVGTAPPGEDDPGHPLTWAPDNAGFVHAPSLPQATTAAILRSGYHSTRVPASGNPLAIDLSSRRLRLAASLLDGVRQGQSLGALLGYRLERDLQDNAVVTMPRFISRLRELAPLRGVRISAPGQPAEPAVAATDVVDGLDLHRQWLHDPAALLDRAVAVPPDDPGRTPATVPERGALEQVLKSLDEAVDALSDAMLVEAVHHAAQGNPMRAGAALDAMAGGDVPAPELEFGRTPRTGIAVTHRVLVLLGDVTADRTAWPVDAGLQQRAIAEPRLDGWAARLLPAPGRGRCRARVIGGAWGEVQHLEVNLTPLKLSALDYVYLSERGAGPGGGELELRLDDHLRSFPAVGDDAKIELAFDRDPAWSPDIIAVTELLEVARTVGRLLGGARPACAADLDMPDRDNVDPRIDAGLTRRADDAVHRLTAVGAALAVDADPESLRRALIQAAHFGLANAYPAAPLAGGEAILRAQAAAVRADIELRRGRLAALDDDVAANKIDTLDHDLGRLAEVFGRGFRALPLLPNPRTRELRTAFAASTALQGGDASVSAGWLTRIARVRAGCDRLVSALHYAEALGTGDALRPQVAQLPHADGERWLALDRAQGTPSGSRVSLVVHCPGGEIADLLGAAVAGLAVDDWTETIPATEATTGVAFHFDGPDAVAPQAILVAVPPDNRERWDTALLEATVADAFELARLRAVDLEALSPLSSGDADALTDIGQFLPAALLATSLSTDVIATDLTGGAER